MGNKGILKMRDIKDILRAWANTRVAKRIGTEYPWSSSGFLCPNGLDFRQYLNDEEAEKVDAAILKLKNDNLEQWAVLTGFYLHNISCTKMARSNGKQTTEITKLLFAAESFIKGCIYDFFSKND